jgi:hypothetical protein
VVEPFSAKNGWWVETIGEFGGATLLQPGTRVHDGSPTMDVHTAVGGGARAIHPPAAAAPLPGLIATSTAAKLGITPGQSFPLHIETNDVDVRLVGVVDYFPTLYPGQDDFLIVPGESLTERLRALGSYAYANEAWMSVSGSTSAAAETAARETRGTAQITDRESLESAALTNPLRLSLDAALVIGFVAALTLVVVSFGLHFLAAARARVGESAIMQANGLPWRVVDRALLVEQAVVLCHGVVVGTVLGAVLAWAILPVLQTSLLPDEIIPRTIVTLDPRTLLGAAAALIAAAAVVGWLAIRAAGGFRLADELRALA